MNINWYPGHMKKTRELIEAHLKLVDVVVEVCDARIPASSRNPIIGDLAAGKNRILILNKNDLADEAATKAWLAFFRGGGINALALNAMSGHGVKALIGKLEKIADEKVASGTSKSKIPLRLMVVGIPNSGKSSLINRLIGKRAAQVGDRPGVTRGKQWLTLENGMQLLDTPGILWPKFEDPNVGLNLAFCGSIRDEIMDVSDLALELLRVLMISHGDLLAERYGIYIAASPGTSLRFVGGEKDKSTESSRLLAAQNDTLFTRLSAAQKDEGSDSVHDDALAVMEDIARMRGYILPGKRIDYERTARALLDEFRAGRIGRITLEYPPITESSAIDSTVIARTEGTKQSTRKATDQ